MTNFVYEFPIHEVMERMGINEINNYPTDKIANFDGLAVIDAWKFMDYQANQPPTTEDLKMACKTCWLSLKQEEKIQKQINERVKTIDFLPYKKHDENKMKALDAAFPPFLMHDPIQAFIDMMSGDPDGDK